MDVTRNFVYCTPYFIMRLEKSYASGDCQEMLEKIGELIQNGYETWNTKIVGHALKTGD